MIIAVECQGVEAAQRLVSLAISCGFRESGITSVSKRVIVAIRCSIRLEVPLGDGEKVMVPREYVQYLVRVANDKMEANRKRTDLFFEKLLENGFPGGSVGACGNGESLAGLEMDQVEVQEAELGYEKQLNQVTDNGNCYVVLTLRMNFFYLIKDWEMIVTFILAFHILQVRCLLHVQLHVKRKV